jgi:hypothetical protein
MRYLFGFLCVCALGVVHVAGCNDWILFDPCKGVVCQDDGNECTSDGCYDGTCNPPVVNGTDCTFDGLSGVCVFGVCGENLCEGVVCDDGLECTKDTCHYVDGTCYFTSLCHDGNECTDDACDAADGKCSHTLVEDGAQCSGDSPSPDEQWVCEAGTCVAPCDPASEEILQCPIKRHEDAFCCPGIEECTTEC